MPNIILVSAQHRDLVLLYTDYLDRWWEQVKTGMVNDLEQIKSGKIQVFGQRIPMRNRKKQGSL